MPPIQSNTNFAPSGETEMPPDAVGRMESGLSYYFIAAVAVAVVLGVMFVLARKIPLLRKHWKKILAGLIAAAVVALILPPYADRLVGDGGSQSSDQVEAGPPVAPPEVTGKIHGLWANTPLAEKIERDGDWMRAVGINTVTFNPNMFHDEIGNITEEEGEEERTKNTINLAHEAGMRVIVEPSPLKAETAPEVDQGEVFMEQMEKISVKYAKIAEEYKAEYFSPLLEPVNHLGPVNASKFMQNVLPKVREVYHGQIVYKKTAIDFTTLLGWRQDVSAEVDFLIFDDQGSFAIDVSADKNRKVFSQASLKRYSTGEFSAGQGGENLAKDLDLQKDQWYTMRIDLQEDKISTYIDGQLINEYADQPAEERAFVLSGAGFRARDLEVTDTAGETLFQDDFQYSNKWTKLPDGWLVKDGEMYAPTQGYAEMIYDMDFSGYDILAINMFREGTEMTDEEYRDYVRFLITRTKEQAADDGVPTVILGEFGGTTLPVMDWETGEVDSSPPLDNAQLARTAQIVLEEAEDTTEGYCYFGWDREGQGIAVIPEVEEVVKNWYNSH